MTDFFSQMDYIFFIYGLSFILLVPICQFLDRRSQGRLAWVWLGIFGVLHGLNEWLDLLSFSLGWGSDPALDSVRLILLASSYVALLEFGRASMVAIRGQGPGRWILAALLGVACLGGLAGWPGLFASSRYALGLVGGLGAAGTLYLASRGRSPGNRALLGAALGMAGYALATGLVVDPAPFFPASLLNTETFSRTLGIPIQFVRGLLAVWICVAIFGAGRAILRSQGQCRRIWHWELGMLMGAGAGLIILVAAGWIFTQYLGHNALLELRKEQDHHARLFKRVLLDQMAQADNLVLTMAGSPGIAPLVATGDTQALRQANSVLDRYTLVSPQSICYLMDLNGLTLASSNRHQPDSFVGQSYGFRPYFQEAVRGAPGRYWALGVTSKELGYYASSPVRDNQGKLVAVAVIKRTIKESEDLFPVQSLGLIIDPRGIVVQANRPDLQLKSLWPLSAAGREEVLASRQFGEGPFQSLLTQEPLNGDQCLLQGKRFLVQRQPFPGQDWAIVTLTSMHPVIMGRLVGIGSTLFLCLILFGLTIIVGLNFDATARVQRSEKRFRELYETMRDGSVAVNLEGKIVAGNPAFQGMLGYSAEEILQLTAQDVSPERWQPLEAQILAEQVLTRGYSDPYEKECRRKDGSRFPVEQQTYLVRDEEGNPAGMWSFIRDITARKQIKDNFLKEKILSDTTIDSLPGVFYLFDHQGRFLRWNENFERASGYSAEEIAGMHPLDFFRGEDQNKVEEGIKEVFVKGEFSVEADLVSKDGRKTPHIFTGLRVTFDGTPYLIGTGIDISDLRQAVKSLQDSEQKYRLLIKTIPAVVFRGYVDWTADFFDEKFEKLTGYTVEDFSSRRIKWSEMILPEDLARAQEIFKRALKTNKSYVREYRIKVRSGSILWIRERGQIICADSGRIDYVTGVFSDITKEHEMEMALEGLRVQNELILNSAGEGIFGVDRTGKTTFINPAALSLTGYEPEEVLGQSLHLLVHHQKPDGAPYPDEECPIYQTIRDGKRRQINDDLFWTKEGKPLPVEYVTTPIAEGGQIVGAVGVFRDITQQKQAVVALRLSEENLRQSQKMEAVGRLAGGVAHDFNNILTAIIGYSELLQGKFEPGDPRLNDTEEIHKAAERAASLTRQLLAFSRKQIFAPKVLNLNNLIMNLDQMLRRLLSEDFKLVTIPGENLGQVMADPGQIEQVIINLAVNARDAMPRGGVLTIETQNVFLDADYAQKYAEVQPGDYVMLAVSDTGSGLDEASRDRIFEPFFTTKELGKGTGMGLSTVHGIIKQSGGHIAVYSEEGQGATFKVYLPRLRQPVQAEPAAPTSCTLDRGTETILLVEDEDLVRRVARRILEMRGYSVLEAASGPDALLVSQQTQGPIHLMLTDVVMPGMSGGETAERLQAERPELKVLFMSGHTENSIVHHGVLDPGVAFIQKPFRSEVLVHKVRQVLDQPPRADGLVKLQRKKTALI